MLFEAFVEELGIASLRNAHLIVQETHDADRVCRQEIHHRLIVDELDMRELNAFTRVQLLLQFESIRVEELLQILIRVIDAQLLERVVFEHLKTEDIPVWQTTQKHMIIER